MTDMARMMAVIFGIVAVLLGVVGFFATGFSGFAADGDAQLLLLDLNPFHNIVHIGVGALWLVGAFLPSTSGTEGVHIGIGLVLLLATILGMAGLLEILSIPAGVSAADVLHLILAVAALAVGLISAGATDRQAAPAA